MKVQPVACTECPFRRNSAQGWLGNNDPETFTMQALRDESLGCHSTFNQELKREDWVKAEAKAPRCFGAMTLMRNECKLPRDYEMMALAKTIPQNFKDFFSNRLEFISYHMAAKVKSWVRKK